MVDYPSFENPVRIGKVSGSPYYDATVENLCYNTDDQSLYFIRGGKLVNVDVATGEETEVAAMDTELDLSGLDYSETEHCFYVVGAGMLMTLKPGSTPAPPACTPSPCRRMARTLP